MAVSRMGSKGPDLEEALKAYFLRAGYFVVRGIAYRVQDEDVTDIDLWLYERPSALTRRRMIVDAKNRKSPKASERIIWTRGLQAALEVDGAIVATTDKRASTRKLAKMLGLTLLDGDAISKLTQSVELQDASLISSEEFNGSVKRIDEGRQSAEWRQHLQDARASLLTGLGVQSTNANLDAAAYFAEQAVLAYAQSEQAKVALRLFYLTSSFAAISLDYALADHAFRSGDERRNAIVASIRFGQSDAVEALPTVRAAIALARKYAENGTAIAKQIEYGYQEDADRIPAEIIADYVVRISNSDALFNIAREIERAAMSSTVPSFDELSVDAKSLLGVFLDFNGIAREKLALVKPSASSTAAAVTKPRFLRETGPLFPDLATKTGTRSKRK